MVIWWYRGLLLSVEYDNSPAGGSEYCFLLFEPPKNIEHKINIELCVLYCFLYIYVVQIEISL